MSWIPTNTIMINCVSHSFSDKWYFPAIVNVTVFWKTDHVVTNTEIHFLPVDESHTHALSRDTKHLSLDGQVCFCRRLFSDDAKPRGCISWPVRPLRGINKTAWADGRLGLPGELCPAGSPTDGTALPFVSECLL